MSTIRLNRRSFLKGLSAASVVALTACQAPVAPAPGQESDQVPEQQGQTLVFWRFPSAVQTAALEDAFSRYAEENPGFAVEMAEFGPMAEYRQKILAAIAANTAPDFLLSDGPWLPEFASRGIISPASPDVEQDVTANWTRGGQSYVTFEGTVYGYPYETSIHQTYVNNAMFEEVGLDPLNPPTNSWTEFREAVNALARVEDGTLVRAGFLANPRLFYLAGFLWNNGAAVVNEDIYGNLQEPVKSTVV